MKRIAVSAALLATVAACAAPTELMLSNPQDRRIDDRAGLTDSITAARCARNMLNASPATQAADITTRSSRFGADLTVDVDATLLNVGVGVGNDSMPVSYRCLYSGASLVKAAWTRGLRGG